MDKSDFQQGSIYTGTFMQPVPDLLTDGGYGPNRRIRVDVAQTSFFAGREFRTFKELNIAASGSYVIKAVVPINIILNLLEVTIDSGSLRVETMVGGTPGGTFSETLPIFGANNMSERPTPFYVNQSTLTAGGTHTGGTVLDVIRLKAAGISVQAASVGSAPFDERGVSANTYYFHLTNLSMTDAVTGTLKARWEERP